MKYPRFLDLPLTVRQQIYEELLVAPIVLNAQGKAIQIPASISILYVNRQIHVESSDIFYAKNLFVVISTNTETYFEEQTTEKAQIFCAVKDPSKIERCHHFAMTLEIIGVSQLWSSQSTPAFVITASALPFFASALINRYKFRNATGVLRCEIHQTFRYTIPRFSSLVFGHFLSADELPQFSAIKIGGDIDRNHYRDLIRKCVSDERLSCAQFTLGNHCYRDRVWFRMNMENKPHSEGIKKEIPEKQICEVARNLIRKEDIFWGCHRFREAELGHKCSHNDAYIFNKMADYYNTLILGHILAAKRYPENAVDAYLEARRAAEEGILYLNRDDRIQYPDRIDGTSEEKSPLQIELLNRAKALLSLKAAKACSKIGDRIAAEAYIKDAAFHTPRMEPRAQERLLKLAWKDWPDLPADSPYIGPAILWKAAAA